MRVLMLMLNYAPEAVGTAVYNAGLARWLAERGHQVTVIAAVPYYPEWHRHSGFRRWGVTARHDGAVRVLHCPIYVPKRPTGLRRLLHHVSFAIAALLPALRAALDEKPDVVWTVCPSLVAAPVARLAALVCGARSWVHVQDFELDAALGTGLLRLPRPITVGLRAVEGAILRSFDRASAIAPFMAQRLVAKGGAPERITELRNWAELEAVTPLAGQSAFREHWRIGTRHVVLLHGSFGAKLAPNIVAEAARLLQDRADIGFVVCASGPGLNGLQTQAAGLRNVRFFAGPVPASELREFLGLATVHLLPQLPGAAPFMLPSRLTNMLASGRPVLATATPDSAVAVELHGCGLVTPPGDAQALADTIVALVEDPERCARLGAAARLRAEQHWNRHTILPAFEAELRALAEARPRSAAMAEVP